MFYLLALGWVEAWYDIGDLGFWGLLWLWLWVICEACVGGFGFAGWPWCCVVRMVVDFLVLVVLGCMFRWGVGLGFKVFVGCG